MEANAKKTQKKDKLFTMKVTQTEKEEWAEIAKSHNLSMSQIVRFCLSREKKKAPKQIIEVDPKLLYEVNAIGNNLNQIARKLNIGDDVVVLPILLKIERHLQEIKDAHKIY